MVNIQERLNPTQHAAVSTINGPLLVIAGAGSGKTRVIEYRVLHLIQSGIEPQSILLLTFTKRASREMLGRASKHDPRCEKVDGGTFHSFCYRILKHYAKTIGFTSSFTVLDEGDAGEAIHRCCSKLGFYDQEKRFPKKSTLRNILSVCVNKDLSVKDVLRRDYAHFSQYAGEIAALRERYAEYKIEKNFLDYDDLLVYTKIVLENENIRRRITEKYKYLMVDEYQDTNSIQGDITYLLGRDHGNVMVVGDDAQSIYGFRGASHKNIMKFPDLFKDCAIIKLEENYRSTQAILDVGNAILANMKNKYTKCLVSTKKVPGDRPRILFFKDSYEEAEWIARSVKTYNDEGLGLKEQAVLFRNLYISIPVQAELSKRNIPYCVFGGLKFYETAHVKDVMSHLKVLSNPLDELSWNRILTLLTGIGPKKAQQISDAIIVAGDFNRIIDRVFDTFSKKMKLGNRLSLLGNALKSALSDRVAIGDKFGIIFDYYMPLMQRKFDDWHMRVSDLESMRQIADRYKNLEEILADFAIEPPERGVLRVDPALSQDEKPITISTIHSAKGLEWDTVFLIGAADGILPSKFSIDDEDDVEEERRLFYVAVTRAKRNLFLSMHHEGNRGGISQFNRVSRFIEEPNVMAKLEKDGFSGDDIIYEGFDSEPDDISEIFGKRMLLKKIKDQFK